MKSPTDVISGLVLLALSGVGFWSVSQITAGASLEHIGPAGVPKAVLYLLVFLSILLIIKGWRNLPEEAYWPKAAILKKITVFILLFYAYLFGVICLGDLFATMENPPFAWGWRFWHKHFSLSRYRASPARQKEASGNFPCGIHNNRCSSLYLWLVFSGTPALTVIAYRRTNAGYNN